MQSASAEVSGSFDNDSPNVVPPEQQVLHRPAQMHPQGFFAAAALSAAATAFRNSSTAGTLCGRSPSRAIYLQPGAPSKGFSVLPSKTVNESSFPPISV